LFEKAWMTSTATFTPSCPPAWIISYQRFSVGSASMAGSPA